MWGPEAPDHVSQLGPELFVFSFHLTIFVSNENEMVYLFFGLALILFVCIDVAFGNIKRKVHRRHWESIN